MNQVEQYFFNGQFRACYNAITDEMTHAAQYKKLLEDYDIHLLPTYADGHHTVERPDETYPQMDAYAALKKIDDEEAFQQAIAKLEKASKEGTDEQKAQSFFTQGMLFLNAHHYNESAHCFMQAVKHNPNDAVYWGIAGQTMSRFGWTPFESLSYIEGALDLDPHNPRWLWNKSLVLTQLYKDLQQQAFLENALVALDDAQQYCREEQMSLRAALVNTVENMREYVFQ